MNILTAFFIVTRHHVYFSKIYNYDDDRILGEHGFKNWDRLYDFDEGFACCQYRPFGKDIAKDKLPEYPTFQHRAFHDYSEPFEKWKFNLKMQPRKWPWPRWVSIGEIQDRTFPLLPEWAKHHIIYSGEAFNPEGYARLALGTAKIFQSGGTTWAYEKSRIIQTPGSRSGLAYLHDDSIGDIFAYALLYERSRAVIHPGGNYQKFNQARVTIIDGPLPKWGQVNLRAQCVGAENAPFNQRISDVENTFSQPTLQAEKFIRNPERKK